MCAFHFYFYFYREWAAFCIEYLCLLIGFHLSVSVHFVIVLVQMPYQNEFTSCFNKYKCNWFCFNVWWDREMCKICVLWHKLFFEKYINQTGGVVCWFSILFLDRQMHRPLFAGNRGLPWAFIELTGEYVHFATSQTRSYPLWKGKTNFRLYRVSYTPSLTHFYEITLLLVVLCIPCLCCKELLFSYERSPFFWRNFCAFLYQLRLNVCSRGSV
jgi:hypothetical protein